MLTVARFTIREAARRRVLLALLFITVAGAALSLLGFSRLPGLSDRAGTLLSTSEVRLIASQLLILVVFMGSFVVAAGAVIAAAPTIAGEVESGVALAVLPRPIRRSDLVLGKWTGLAVVVVVFVVIAVTMELAAVRLTTGYLPPEPIRAVTFLAAEGLAALTLALFLSTRVSSLAGGILGIAAWGLAWIGGIVGGIGSAFHNDGARVFGAVTALLMPTDGLWRSALYGLEPDTVRAAASTSAEASATPFVVTATPQTGYLVWVGLWIVGITALAVWSFRQRDL